MVSGYAEPTKDASEGAMANYLREACCKRGQHARAVGSCGMKKDLRKVWSRVPFETLPLSYDRPCDRCWTVDEIRTHNPRIIYVLCVRRQPLIGVSDQTETPRSCGRFTPSVTRLGKIRSPVGEDIVPKILYRRLARFRARRRVLGSENRGDG